MSQRADTRGYEAHGCCARPSERDAGDSDVTASLKAEFLIRALPAMGKEGVYGEGCGGTIRIETTYLAGGTGRSEQHRHHRQSGSRERCATEGPWAFHHPRER